MGWGKEANLWGLVPGEALVLDCVMRLTSGVLFPGTPEAWSRAMRVTSGGLVPGDVRSLGRTMGLAPGGSFPATPQARAGTVRLTSGGLF